MCVFLRAHPAVVVTNIVLLTADVEAHERCCASMDEATTIHSQFCRGEVRCVVGGPLIEEL
jgi:hypothetical protein